MSNTNTNTPKAKVTDPGKMLSMLQAWIVMIHGMIVKLPEYTKAKANPAFLTGLSAGYEQSGDSLSVQRMTHDADHPWMNGDVTRERYFLGLYPMHRGHAYIVQSLAMIALHGVRTSLGLTTGGKRGRDWTQEECAALETIGFIIGRYAKDDEDQIRGFGPIGITPALAKTLKLDAHGAKLDGIVAGGRVRFPVKAGKDGAKVEMTVKQATAAVKKARKERAEKRATNEATRKADPSVSYQCGCKVTTLPSLPYSLWSRLSIECVCGRIAVVSNLVKGAKGEAATFTVVSVMPEVSEDVDSSALDEAAANLPPVEAAA